ncbi:MAG TPA: NAD-dependent epimerase/dehydratase family protein [Gemmatimonadaceae bacterium]|nr:NAD-dependent epimerase/dehydratase family protein [Gemmatimonadaceae bacterium]
MSGRVLVTGGAGFIGSHVCDRFLEAGWAVEIIDDLSSGKRENVDARARLHVVDIRSETAAELIDRGRFDVLVHLAAQMDVRRSVADPLFDAGVNVLGTVNLLEAVRRSGHRPRFIFASTGGAIYGDLATPPNSETTQKNPDSPYAASKLAAEYYLGYYGRIHGLDTLSLRFANVYGPRQDPHGEAGVVAIFCGRMLADEALTVFGDGTQTRDYVYVGDVADAVVAAAKASLPEVGAVDARAFNIGTGVATSVLDLASALFRATNKAPSIDFAPRRPGEQQDSSLHIDKARETLGWEPRMSLDQGLAETFTWFAARQSGEKTPAGAS